MKKVLLSLFVFFAAVLSGNAVPLFPYFVDLTGNYTYIVNNGFALINGKSSTGGQQSCEIFLADVLPSNDYTKEVKGTKEYPVVVYKSLIVSTGQISAIYLVNRKSGYFIYYSESTKEQQAVWEKEIIEGKI